MWVVGGGSALHSALTEHYSGSAFVEVMPFGEEGVKEAGLLERAAFLRPDSLNDSNKLQVSVMVRAVPRVRADPPIPPPPPSSLFSATTTRGRQCWWLGLIT